MIIRTSKAKCSLLAIVITLITVLFSLSLYVLTAAAHGPEILAEASPSDGAQLSESPLQITMVFTAELHNTPPLTAPHLLEVYDLDGNRVDLEDTHIDASEVERQIMTVSLPTLDQGVYMVRWSVSPTDGDIVNGLHFFSVGELPGNTNNQSSNEKNTADPVQSDQATAGESSTPVIRNTWQSWPMMIGSVIVLGIVATMIYLRRKPR